MHVASTGQLVVRRPWDWRGFAVSFRIYVDSVLVGSLRPGQSLAVDQPTGLHSVHAVSIGTESFALEVDLAVNQTISLIVKPAPGSLSRAMSGAMSHTTSSDIPWITVTQVDPPGATVHAVDSEGASHRAAEVPEPITVSRGRLAVMIFALLFGIAVVVNLAVHHDHMTPGRWAFGIFCLVGIVAISTVLIVIYRSRAASKQSL